MHPAAYSPDSRSSLRAIPGRLTTCSIDCDWQSILVGRHTSDPSRTTHETTATPDLTVGVALDGDHRLDVLCDGTWRSAHYGPGAIGLTMPGETDRLRWRSDGPFDVVHAYLPGTLLLAACEQLRRAGRPLRLPALSALVLADPAVVATVEALVAGIARGAPDLYAEQAAQWLATHLLVAHGGADPTHARPTSTRPPDGRLRRAIGLMRARYAEPLSLDALATEAGISRFHFARLFKERTGRAPHAYLTDVRMEAARDLLEQGEIPVGLVAERTGYRGVSQFGAAFRRAHGVTATEYRETRSERQGRAV